MGSPFLLEGDASVIQDFSCMPCDGYDQHDSQVNSIKSKSIVDGLFMCFRI